MGVFPLGFEKCADWRVFTVWKLYDKREKECNTPYETRNGKISITMNKLKGFTLLWKIDESCLAKHAADRRPKYLES